MARQPQTSSTGTTTTPIRRRGRRARPTNRRAPGGGMGTGTTTSSGTGTMMNQELLAAHTHGEIAGLRRGFELACGFTPAQAKQRLERYGAW